MERELMIYDEIGACRVGAAFCPSPFAAAARDPHVSFSPFFYGTVNTKMLFLGGSAAWRCLSSWRSECLCLFVHKYQKLMSLHCILHFVLQLPTTSPCPSSMGLSSPESPPWPLPCLHGAQPPKPPPSSLPCFCGTQPPKSFSMVPALLQQGSDSQSLSHGACPALLGQSKTFWGRAELAPICVASWTQTALRPEKPLTSPLLKDVLQRHSLWDLVSAGAGVGSVFCGSLAPVPIPAMQRERGRLRGFLCCQTAQVPTLLLLQCSLMETRGSRGWERGLRTLCGCPPAPALAVMPSYLPASPSGSIEFSVFLPGLDYNLSL